MKYQNRQKEKQLFLQNIVQEIQTQHNTVKYMTNKKRESQLQKPQFSTLTQLTAEKISELKQQLACSGEKFNLSSEKFCIPYKPIIKDKNSVHVENLLGRARKLYKRPTQKLIKQDLLDQQQMKTFMQLFQAESVQHKKSKYEALMNRLKEQMPQGQDLDVRYALIHLTPQFEEYKRLKQLHIKEMSNSKPDESKIKAIDLTLHKLGLDNPKSKKRRLLNQITKTEGSLHRKQDSDLKSQRNKTLEASLSCQSASQKQFMSILEQQKLRGQLIQKLLEVKFKVKTFYDTIVDYQQRIILLMIYKEKQNNLCQELKLNQILGEENYKHIVKKWSKLCQRTLKKMSQINNQYEQNYNKQTILKQNNLSNIS